MSSPPERILEYLLFRGPAAAREIYGALGISQASFSLSIAKLRKEVVILGTGRGTRYARLRAIPEVPPNVSVYSISETGASQRCAELVAVQPKGFYVRSHADHISSGYHEDLPYWMDTIRPSGYLGRLIPRRHPELRFPEDIRQWSDDHVLRYATVLGADLMGHLVLGDRALELATRTPAVIIPEKRRAEEYARLAVEVVERGAAGSSAGGEQPKFLAVKERGVPVLVKFSPRGTEPLHMRRKDLLICEHHALSAASACGHDAAHSELITASEQMFLEVTRFDRVPPHGRRGLLTLEALDAQFAAQFSSWREIAAELLRLRIIEPEQYREVLWRHYYGGCIGNSDMHAANLSFFVHGEKILGLAPIYDMLPMSYAPRAEQLVQVDAVLPAFYPHESEIWQSASEAAQEFWNRVSADKRVSREMRDVAEEWREKLARSIAAPHELPQTAQ